MDINQKLKEMTKLAAELADESAKRADVDAATKDLLAATNDLMEIVEGIRCVRWQHEGGRLKDTPEWCRLYVAWSNLNRMAEASNAGTQRGRADDAPPATETQSRPSLK